MKQSKFKYLARIIKKREAVMIIHGQLNKIQSRIDQIKLIFKETLSEDLNNNITARLADQEKIKLESEAETKEFFSDANGKI